jgi:sigma-B regulation protein RsbU (phosphoserine phosphatase)
VRGLSIPAREVSGDFHNYFPLTDRSIALLVGDVSGKGVPAALLMANLQASLRAMLLGSSDLGPLVGRLDREVDANTPTEMYATLFVAILDAPEARLRYVNAGHNPPFALHPDGQVEQLKSGGRPVGLLPGKSYQEGELQLQPGTILFMYSDGVVESENPAGEQLGMERVEELLRQEQGQSLERLFTAFERTLEEHRQEAEPSDDATLLALRFHGWKGVEAVS